MQASQINSDKAKASAKGIDAHAIVNDAERMLASERKNGGAKPEERREFPFIHVPYPKPLDDFLNRIEARLQKARVDSITTLPSFVVNNSSNFIGATQLIGEVLYYKSNNLPLYKEGWKATNKLGPLGYVVHPIQNMYGQTFSGIWHSIVDTKGKVLLPAAWWKGIKNLPDLKGAAYRDSNGFTKKLSNTFGARAGLSGASAMVVALLLPDHNETQEEIDHYTQMQQQSPVRYYGTRIYQAVNPLEWGKHKRQFSGLGMTSAGVFSFLSGWRQPTFTNNAIKVDGRSVFSDNMAKAATQQQKYTRNFPHMIGGLITAFAGLQLMMSVDSQSAWTNYGKTQFLRLTILPFSIANRFANKTIGALHYLGAQTMFQTKNLVAAVIGGAEKKPDGTIVDYKAMREEAKQKVKAKSEKQTDEVDAQPFAAEKETAGKISPNQTQYQQEVAPPHERSTPNTKILSSEIAQTLSERDSNVVLAN